MICIVVVVVVVEVVDIVLGISASCEMVTSLMLRTKDGGETVSCCRRAVRWFF